MSGASRRIFYIQDKYSMNKQFVNNIRYQASEPHFLVSIGKDIIRKLVNNKPSYMKNLRSNK